MLAETADWTVVVDNQPGASGMIATDAAARSPADCYTLLRRMPRTPPTRP